jgi:signal transduction histidine kinase
VAHLPARYQQGRMPYVFFFVLVVMAVLLTYAVISPHAYASAMFSSYAAFLLVLLLVVNRGFSLSRAIHLGTGLGACVLFYEVWVTGGVHSPSLAWMLILPLTPFYMIHRRAGLFWLLIALALQGMMFVSNHLGWVQPFETGTSHLLPSFLTYALVTCVLIVVPLMYDHMYRQALEESRVYQRELELRREELEHTSAMREHFIATVSHELRTPMNAILGFNALLLARVKDKPEALKVLNLSELVIALRPEVQPGDELQIKIARDGKEADQGVGYLDDGTMVVVEGARGRIGERLPVVVTGALQNPTGRIVFARPGSSQIPSESAALAAPGPTNPKRKAKPKASPPKPEAGSPS